MSTESRIIEFNRLHPEWHAGDLAHAVGCTENYVRKVCQRHHLVRRPKPRPTGVKYNVKPRAAPIAVRVDDDMDAWLHDEAQRMGPGVNVSDVVVAILRDAKAGD